MLEHIKAKSMKNITGLLGGILFTPQLLTASITIQFDYSNDSNNFFNSTEKKSVLEAAATSLSSYINDSLSAIIPSGGNTWKLTYSNPSTGASTEVNNPSINANTVLIYIGGRDLSGSTLGQGGSGGYSSFGSSAWNSTVAYRGQSGAPNNDFSCWGGSISFDNTTSWYFDADLASSADIPATSYDFYSVAVHEIAHVLGFGLAQSWTTRVNTGTFIGTNSMSLYGGAVPLYSNSHWAQGTLSTLPGTSTTQEAAMDPDIGPDVRKYFTSLDFAGLKDIGWETTPVPELEHTMGFASMALMGFAMWRRRHLKEKPSSL